jgi:hypothetical protein
LGDLFDVHFEAVPDEASLRKVLSLCIGRPGVTLVHVPTDRIADRDHFRRAVTEVDSVADAAAGGLGE